MSAALVRLCFAPSSADELEPRASIRRTETSHGSNAGSDARIARLRAGDVATFEALMRERFTPLVVFAIGFLDDRLAAEDVVQDIFTRLWAQRESLQLSSLSSYLYGAVRNGALDVVRQRAIRKRLEGPLQTAITAELEARLPGDVPEEDRERFVRVQVALQRLPERRRSALRLRYEQELSYDEIAVVLGLSVGAAQQLVFHAIRALRRSVELDEFGAR